MTREQENALVEAAAVLDFTIAALKGEPVSEFAESFWPVAEVSRLQAELEEVKAHSCQCGMDEACAFLRRAEAAEAELAEAREALAEAAEVLDTATFRTSTKTGNASRARGWLGRWKHFPEVARALSGTDAKARETGP